MSWRRSWSGTPHGPLRGAAPEASCQGRPREQPLEKALDLYRRARTAEPDHRVVEYRLSRALRHVGETAEADRIERRIRRRDLAIQELRPLYEQATATSDLGIRPHPDLYQKIAVARERMQLPEEASAWHRLVLGNDPKNENSLAALARAGG